MKLIAVALLCALVSSAVASTEADVDALVAQLSTDAADVETAVAPVAAADIKDVDNIIEATASDDLTSDLSLGAAAEDAAIGHILNQLDRKLHNEADSAASSVTNNKAAYDKANNAANDAKGRWEEAKKSQADVNSRVNRQLDLINSIRNMMADLHSYKLVAVCHDVRKQKTIAAKDVTTSSQYSYSFWVYERSVENVWRTLVHRGAQDSVRTPAFWLYPGESKIHVRVGTAGSWNDGCDCAISTKAWNFITLTVDKSTITTYRNGNKCCTQGHKGATAPSGPLYIKDPWYQAANAQISDLRVYPYALTASEVKEYSKSQPHCVA